MSAPRDPVAYELFRERLRVAQRARWARPGQREHARQKAVEQYQRPGARERNAQRRREWWAAHPEQRARLSALGHLRQYTEARRTAKARKKLISERAQCRARLHIGTARDQKAPSRPATSSRQDTQKAVLYDKSTAPPKLATSLELAQQPETTCASQVFDITVKAKCPKGRGSSRRPQRTGAGDSQGERRIETGKTRG